MNRPRSQKGLSIENRTGLEEAKEIDPVET